MEIIRNIYKRIDDRGTFFEYFNSDVAWKSINGAMMHKGAMMGNHYHKKCRVLFFLIAGSAEVLAKNIQEKDSRLERLILQKDEGVIYEPYETHVEIFLEDSSFLVLKSEKYSETDKDIYEAKLTS